MTITETLAHLAASLNLVLHAAGDVARSGGGLTDPELVASIVSMDGPDPEWIIRVEICVPSGNFDPAQWARFRGDCARLDALQSAALAIIGGRTWKALK